MALLIAVPLLGQHFIRRAKEWHQVVGDVEHLVRELGSHTGIAGSDAVVIPQRALETIASIESAQIARDRRSAIAAGAGVEGAWGFLTTREFSASRSRLSREDQLAVQDLLDQLSLDPRATPAREGADGSWRARGARGVEVVYRLDETRRHLRLVSLEAVGTSSLSSTSWYRISRR